MSLFELLFAVLCLIFLANESYCRPPDDISTESLLSWRKMEKSAGYYTSDDRYRGGRPWRIHKTEDGAYSCNKIDSTKSYCEEWSGGVVTDDHIGDNINCNCSEGSTFCRKWECVTDSTDKLCKDPVSCVLKGGTQINNCECIQGSASESPFCQIWSCTEYNIRGLTKVENYTCLEEETGGDFCNKWSGEINTEREVRSTACECFNPEDKYCRLWLCNTRRLTRCSEKHKSWCNLSVALAVYGVIGLAIMTAAFGGVLAIQKDFGSVARVLMFWLLCLLLVMPFIAGVSVSGGVYGVGWVSLMWGIPFVTNSSILWFFQKPIQSSL